MTDQFEVQRFARDFARRLAKLERAQRRTAASPNTLNHAAIDGGELVVKDDQGNTKYHLGTDPVTGVTAPKFEPGPVPARPEAPDLEAREGAVHVELSGLDVDENPAPADLKHAEIHMSLDEGFEVTPGTMVTSTPNPADGVSISKASGVWWVRVVWVTLSGQRSEPSEAVSVDIVPPVDAQDLQDTLDAAQEALDEYRDEVAAPRFQALETGLSESNDSLDDARTRLSAAEQTLSPLPGRISTAEQEVQDAKEEATKAAAAAVEANNRAMTRLANGNFESGLDYWSHSNVELTSTAHSGQQAAQIGGWLRPGSSFPVVPEQIWELSLYYQYDVTVEFQALDGDTRTVLSTHHLDGDSSWSDSGALRVTIPADVHMLSFTITGTNAIVDDITLRDVTDVVRLEEAANANRQKAEQAISELAVLQLAVDGEGGLKDRLTSAETVLETKADEAVVDNVAAGLAGLSGLNTKTYIQDEEPPAPSGAVTYEWEGTPHASPSVKKVDGVVVARNYFGNPNFEGNNEFFDYSQWLAFYGIKEVSDAPSGGRVFSIQARDDARNHSFNRFLPVIPGPTSTDQWIAIAADTRLMQANSGFQVRVQYTQGSSTTYVSLARVTHQSWQRTVFGGVQIPAGATDVKFSFYINNGASLTDAAPPNAEAQIDRLDVSVASTEQAALDQAQTYYDGDSENVPAETGLWIRGDQKYWFDHSTKTWVEVTDTGAFARLIANELFANLAVVDRLQAREGWIGGTLLEDGAVTAEKITATRELITKIMGAEWAYIAQQLIVDGSILTRDLKALSAAIQSLTVTQRADIAQLWAEELWTALAVIEELQAEEAWITSAMISELTAEKVTVTQNFVGRVAELLHLVVDRIDANALWADQTWQNAAYFGGTEGDYQTQVDAQGLSVWRQVEGEQQLATRLGPGENALSFFDEDTGQLTGSLSQDGSANLQETAVQSLNIAGRDLTHTPHEYQPGVPLLDSMPRGVWVAGPVDMSGVEVQNQRLGFLELSAPVIKGRMYRLTTNNFLVDNDKEYRARFRYTLCDDGMQVPTVASPELGMWVPNSTSTNVQTGGRIVFEAPQTGVIRVLLCMETRLSSISGIRFNSSATFAGDVRFWMEDLGPRKPGNSRRRYSVSGGDAPTFLDDTPGKNTYQTEWVATWNQSYYNGGATRRPAGNTPNYGGNQTLPQGLNPRLRDYGAWTSLAGFSGATTSSHTSEQGLSFQAALNGADIQSVVIVTTGAGSLGDDSRFFQRLHWAEHTTAPNTYTRNVNRHMGGGRVDPGWTKEWEVPQEYWPLLQTGDWKALGLADTDYDNDINKGWLAWGNQRPRVIVTYQK